MNANIAQEARKFALLREELLRRYPSLADDEDALADTLEGLSDLDQMLAALVKSIDDDETLIAGIDDRQKELDQRNERIEARRQAKQSALLFAMQESGKRKLELPIATISIRANPPSVIVADETQIPAAYIVTPEPTPRPDKRAILAALKAGETVPGCVLNNGGESLAWRKK